MCFSGFILAFLREVYNVELAQVVIATIADNLLIVKTVKADVCTADSTDLPVDSLTVARPRQIWTEIRLYKHA